MGRLIDADALIEAIYQNSDIGFYGEFMDGSDCAYTHIEILNEIKKQPTAYNVEKVIEQLEEEREYSYADFEEYVDEKSPCLDAEYDDYFHRGLERAIKLVKRGGVECLKEQS